MRTIPVLLLLLLLAPSADAQAQQRSITAGMTFDEVVQRLGQPARTRVSGEWRYLFYTNDCSPRCGSDDVVFVHRGEVVSAVLRDSRRRYSGPGTGEALPPLAASRALPATGDPAARPPAAIEGIRVEMPPEAAPEGAVQIVEEPRPPLLGEPARPLLGVPVDEQRAREQRVEPRTVPTDTTIQQRREREQRVEPRTSGNL